MWKFRLKTFSVCVLPHFFFVFTWALLSSCPNRVPIVVVLRSSGPTVPLVLCSHWSSVLTVPLVLCSHWSSVPAGPLTHCSSCPLCPLVLSPTGPLCPLVLCTYWSSGPTVPLFPPFLCSYCSSGPLYPLVLCSHCFFGTLCPLFHWSSVPTHIPFDKDYSSVPTVPGAGRWATFGSGRNSAKFWRLSAQKVLKVACLVCSFAFVVALVQSGELTVSKPRKITRDNIEKRSWVNLIYLTVIVQILEIKYCDLQNLWNISRGHLRLAEIDRCKLQTMLELKERINNWRHAASNPQGCLTVMY